MVFKNVDVNVPKKQGNVGVARAVYEYTRMGFAVLAPLSDSDKYDLVIDDGTKLKKVQVKTSRCKKKDYTGRGRNTTGYAVQLATTGGNTKSNTRRLRQVGDYDLLFVLIEDGRCWSIPASVLGATGQLQVGAEGPRAKYNEYEVK